MATTVKDLLDELAELVSNGYGETCVKFILPGYDTAGHEICRHVRHVTVGKTTTTNFKDTVVELTDDTHISELAPDAKDVTVLLS